MENIEFNENDALAESEAEDAAIAASHAGMFDGDGNLTGGLAFAATPEVEPVSRASMLGVGGRIVLSGKPCRLSALSMLEADDVQAALGALPPLLYAAVLTDPPKGADAGGIDPQAVAGMAGLLTQSEPLDQPSVRTQFRRMAAFLEAEHRTALTGVVLTSLRKRSPGVTEADLLAALSLADLIGCIRYIFDLSGGLSEVFCEG